MKVDPSFRKENQSSSRNDSHRHFETRVHPSFRNDSAASFQNDSFVYDKSPINLKQIYVTHFEMIKDMSFGNDTHIEIFP